jgi:hypothetical protein
MSAAVILNRSPTKAADKTPYELWKRTVSNLSFIWVWDAKLMSSGDTKTSSAHDRSKLTL